MKKLYFIVAAGVLCASCSQKAPQGESTVQLKPEEIIQAQSQAAQIFGALPERMPGSEGDTPELVALGGQLYHEKALSANNAQSCNTCHELATAGVDNQPTSTGAHSGKGTRNSPTVLNAGFQFAQFWDGRAKDLKEQAKGPMLNPAEMALKNEKDAEKAIAAIPLYADLFAKAFPGVTRPISFDNIAHAIAAFERTLIAPSRFDQFCKGNAAALTHDEIAGLRTFISAGCITCHVGPLVGGSMFQKLGLVKSYATRDEGRFTVTKNEADRFMFKVPMLRNIARTAPYLHDGSIATLDEMVKIMADINLGKQLTGSEAKSIITYLHALSSEQPPAS